MVQKGLRNDTRELEERNRQTDSVVIRRQKKMVKLYSSVCEQKLWVGLEVRTESGNVMSRRAK